MEIALLSVFSLLVILFFAGFWPASRTWKWFHLFFLSLVLISASFYLCFGAMMLKTRIAWGTLHQKAQKDLKAVQEVNDELRKGTAATPKKYPWMTQPLAKHGLERLLLSRGRTWRGCGNQGADAAKGTVVIRTPLGPAAPVLPANVAAAAPADAGESRSHGISEHTILFCFSEARQSMTDSAGNVLELVVPDLYLGEFEVIATTPDSVTLKPTLPPDPQQIQVLIARTATWTMYERMPTDSQDSYEDFLEFVNLTRSTPRPQGTDLAPDIDARVNPERAARVSQVFTTLIKKLPDVSDDNYAKIIRQFLRDGGSSEQDDPPDRIYARVRFLKPYEVSVDSPNKQVRLDSEYFDSRGLAVMPGLRRDDKNRDKEGAEKLAEDKVKFAAGDFAIVHQQKADELVNEGVCERVQNFYRRPLNDYKIHFHTIFHRIEYLTDQITDIQRLIETTDNTQKQIQAQVDYRTRELMKLQQDLVKHRAELVAITEYDQQVRDELTAVRGRVNALNESNHKLVEDMATLQAQMADEIIRNSKQASR